MSLPPNATVATRANRAALQLKQASDPTRLAILMLLAKGEINVGPICEALGNMNQPAVSSQLKLLTIGGLAESRRDGHRMFYSLTDRGRALVAMADSLND